MPHTYEWSVLRAVPRVDRCEFVNVGVIVYCQPVRFLAARVTDDLDRARALDPALDVDAVRRALENIRAVCDGEPQTGENGRRPPGERFRWLVAPRSTVVQPSPVHTGITTDPATELDKMFARMVAPPNPSGTGPSGTESERR